MPSSRLSHEPPLGCAADRALIFTRRGCRRRCTAPWRASEAKRGGTMTTQRGALTVVAGCCSSVRQHKGTSLERSSQIPLEAAVASGFGCEARRNRLLDSLCFETRVRLRELVCPFLRRSRRRPHTNRILISASPDWSRDLFIYNLTPPSPFLFPRIFLLLPQSARPTWKRRRLSIPLPGPLQLPGNAAPHANAGLRCRSCSRAL